MTDAEITHWQNPTKALSWRCSFPRCWDGRQEFRVIFHRLRRGLDELVELGYCKKHALDFSSRHQVPMP